MGVVLLNLLALALAVYAVGLVFTSNFNMGNLLVWLLAAAVAGYAIFRKPLNVWFSHGAGRVVLVLLCGCLLYGLPEPATLLSRLFAPLLGGALAGVLSAARK